MKNLIRGFKTKNGNIAYFYQGDVYYVSPDNTRFLWKEEIWWEPDSEAISEISYEDLRDLEEKYISSTKERILSLVEERNKISNKVNWLIGYYLADHLRAHDIYRDKYKEISYAKEAYIELMVRSIRESVKDLSEKSLEYGVKLVEAYHRHGMLTRLENLEWTWDGPKSMYKEISYEEALELLHEADSNKFLIEGTLYYITSWVNRDSLSEKYKEFNRIPISFAWKKISETYQKIEEKISDIREEYDSLIEEYSSLTEEIEELEETLSEKIEYFKVSPKTLDLGHSNHDGTSLRY